MKQAIARLIGLGMVGVATYVGSVRLPAAYPMFFKATGVAVLTRNDMNKVAAVYGLTGALGGFGLALLVLGAGKGSRR